MLDNPESYTEITNILNHSGAEAHGMLIAFFCLDEQNAMRLWTQEIGILFENDKLSVDIANNQIIKDWAEQSHINLQNDNFGFKLFLPYNQTLNQQITAFKEWCNGFLYVIGIMQTKMEGDCAEFIEDMVSFSDIELQAEDNEEELLAFEELCGYTAVGVLLCASYYQTKNSTKNPDANHY